MREIQNFEPGISLLSFQKNTLARSLLWNSKSTANMSFRCSQVLGNPFLNAAPKTVRVLQLQHVWERPMNFFLRSAAELVLCFPDGIEGERHEAEDAEIVN